MPLKSEAQRRYLFAKHPAVAKEFAAATPKGAKLPEHVKNMAKGGMVDDGDESWEDHGSHFIRTKGGQSMKIAKNKLGTRVLNSFQALCNGGTVAGMASGGMVKKYSKGDYVVGDDDAAIAETPDFSDVPSAVEQEANRDMAVHPPSGTPTADAVMHGVNQVGQAMNPIFPGAGLTALIPGAQTDVAPRDPNAQTAEVPPGQPQPEDQAGQGVALPQAPHMNVPGMLPEQRAAYEASKSATQRLGDIEQGSAVAQADAYEKGQAAIAAADAERKKSLDTMRGSLDQVREEYRNGKIDPQQYWKNAGAAGQVTAAIGILLSGYGQGLAAAGGKSIPNMALEAINKNIERNIEAQKENLQAKGNEYRMLREQLGDAEQADAVMHARGLEMVKNQVQTIALRSMAPAAKARADQLVAAIDQQQANTLWGIANARAQASFQTSALQFQVGVATAKEKAKADKEKSIQARSLSQLLNPVKAKGVIDQIRASNGVKQGRLAGAAEMLHGLPGGTGEMPETDWERQTDLLIGEAAQFAKGGVGDAAEIEAFKHQRDRAKSSAQREQFLNSFESYFKHGLATINENLVAQKYTPIVDPWKKKSIKEH